MKLTTRCYILSTIKTFRRTSFHRPLKEVWLNLHSWGGSGSECIQMLKSSLVAMWAVSPGQATVRIGRWISFGSRLSTSTWVQLRQTNCCQPPFGGVAFGTACPQAIVIGCAWPISFRECQPLLHKWPHDLCRSSRTVTGLSVKEWYSKLLKIESNENQSSSQLTQIIWLRSREMIQEGHGTRVTIWN